MNDDTRIDPPRPWTARRPELRWIVLGLAAVFLLSCHFGYQVGADLAKREHHRDCVAAGGADCERR